jgi:hypothetical protein
MAIKNWEYLKETNRFATLPYAQVGLIGHAIFADTQDEPQAVYDHLGWLVEQCRPHFQVLVRSKGCLGDNLVNGINADGLRFVSIPAFVKGPEREGMTKRQCTQEYKIEVIERAIRYDILGLAPRQRIPKEIQIEQIFGLSYDEPGRIARVKMRRDTDQIETIFPLFEMEMTRGSCLTWLKKQNIPHTVPRSACVYCPYHDNAEWRWIRDNDPEGWKRAVQIDEAIRDHDSVSQKAMVRPLYVHRSCVPLAEADLDTIDERDTKKGQLLFWFNQECDGLCGQ